jgi:glycosyltransferase involved in cell wall biosynthesis
LGIITVPHIAMVIQRYYPHVGGAEKQLQRLIPRLQARGFEVCVVTRKETGLESFVMVEGAPVYRVTSPGPKVLAGALFTLSAARLLSRLRPDVIHAHEILSPASAALLAKRFHGWPVIAKILRGGISGDIYKLKRRLFGMQRFNILRQKVDAFVVISREIDDELAELNVPVEKRVFIPNGVDTEYFAPPSNSQKKQLRAELSIPPQATVVVYLGRLVAEKRIDHLLRIWTDVKTAFPETLLLIVGMGSEESRLRSMAGKDVQFTGQIQDAARYLQAADLFVSPSSTEGLSNSLLEALSSGLPVLVTSVGGARDVIQHNINGYLIPPDDLPSLRIGLLTLLGDSTMRRRLGESGRQRILSDYSLDAIANQLADLYTRFING